MRDILRGKPESKIEFQPKTCECIRSRLPLDTVDGCLDKPFWAQTKFSEEFEDIMGNKKGKKPYKSTRVKLLYDDEALYIGAYLCDDRLWATVIESDFSSLTDNGFRVLLDPDGDSHNYYDLTVTPLNTVRDVLMTRPYRDQGICSMSTLRDRGLQTAVHIDGNLNDPSSVPLNRGWSVEIKIPWSAIISDYGQGAYNGNSSPFNIVVNEGRVPVPGEKWRVNFARIEWLTEITEDEGYSKIVDPETGMSYLSESWLWSPIGSDDVHMPELWGYMYFQNEGNTLPAFTPDRTERVKWLMRRLYYYYADKKQYAVDYAALCGGRAEIDADIYATPHTFEACTYLPDGRCVTVYSDGLVNVK